MTTRLRTTASAISVAAALALTGCAGYGQPPAAATPVAQAPSGPTATPAPVDVPAMAAPCNAQPAQFAVGQSSTATVMESARVRSGAQMARILRPGQMITKEFNAQRLNLEVDGTGRIIAVRCG
ncbi:I78 family peptidase inhibitor [Acidovorax sp. BL-A-41-H1]|uniref:I78 family peptidase inhibitor n=1 Tax=Acidovorax sp. BL-A-41-H1 TaxID=3421102 RepID=UPI003F7A4A27